MAKVRLPYFQRSKIGPRTVDVIFIGHAHNSVACRFILKDDSNFNAIRESRDAKFFKHIFSVKTFVNNCLPTTSTSCHNTTSYGNLDQEPKPSKGARTETSFGPNFVTIFLVDIDVLSE